MKKIVNLILVLVLCMGLTGCGGNSKPDNMSDESYEAGLDILEATDDYLDDKIDDSELESSIDSLLDNVDGDGTGDVAVRESANQIQLSLYISRNSVKDSRDELAEALGK